MSRRRIREKAKALFRIGNGKRKLIGNGLNEVFESRLMLIPSCEPGNYRFPLGNYVLRSATETLTSLPRNNVLRSQGQRWGRYDDMSVFR